MPRIFAAVSAALALALGALFVWSPAEVPAAPAPVPGSYAAAPSAQDRFEAAKERAELIDPVRARYVYPSRMYYGLSVPGLPRDLSQVETFSEAAGKSPNMLMSFQSFTEDFDVSALRAVSASGALPVVSWEPWDHRSPEENVHPLRSIASGEYDEYLRRQAQLVRDSGMVLGVRLAHEMNGNWYPWGLHTPDRNQPADYVAMFRHVHDIFAAEGAENVIWIWSPNMVESATRYPLAPLYPGDRYVDWVGIVGYLTSEDRYYGFSKVYEDTFVELDRVAPTKPIVVTEISVAPQDDPEVRPHLISDMLSSMEGTPRLVGFVWFNLDKRHEDRSDWRLETDPVSAAAFRSGISSFRFGAASLSS